MKLRTLPPGVYAHGQRFKAQPSIGGQVVYLGLFETVEAATQEIDVARELYAKGAEARRRDTFRAWAMEWLDERETSGAHRSARTDRSRMARHVFSHDWVDMPIRSIRVEHLRAWLHALERTKAAVIGEKGEHVEARRTLSPQTVQHVCNLVRKAFSEAVRAGKLRESPAADIRPRRQPNVERAIHLSQAQIVRLLALPRLPLRIRAIYTVAIYTGLRAGELWALRWKDVDEEGERPELVVRASNRNATTKTDEIRVVPLLPPAIEALREWREASAKIGSPLVFPAGSKGHGRGWKGWHQATEGYDASWSTWARHAKIDSGRIKFRHLRHTCGAHLAAGTWGVALTLYQVAAWLGHADSRTTEEHYAHLTPDALHGARRKLAEAMAVDMNDRHEQE